MKSSSWRKVNVSAPRMNFSFVVRSQINAGDPLAGTDGEVFQQPVKWGIRISFSYFRVWLIITNRSETRFFDEYFIPWIDFNRRYHACNLNCIDI